MMHADVREKIFVFDPTPAMKEWCRISLIVPNPEYEKKSRMGLWTGSTPREFWLYEKTDRYLALPFGCLNGIHEAFPDMPMKSHISPVERVNYCSNINLYDYQKNAVEAVLGARNGVLVMPCGAGKTQVALEAISRIGMKALWLTHTQDLLMQSKARAQSVFGLDASCYGTITGGKVDVGRGITFATVQTMSKIDLAPYRDEWGVIVVDECLPGNTKIMTDCGEKELMFLSIGDKIASYNRNIDSVEYKPVTNTFKLKAHDIVKITLENGEVIYSTNNHPFFTDFGWLEAKDIIGGKHYVMQLLWSGNRRKQAVKNKPVSKQKERLGILLKKLFDKRRSQKGCLDGRQEAEIVGKHETNKRKISRADCRQDEKSESYARSRGSGKGFETLEGNRASSQNKMWKRTGSDCTTADVSHKVGGFYGCLYGISDSDKNEKKLRIPNLLQGRHSDSGRNACYRSRRKLALCNRETETRREKGYVYAWVRVESVEVQKQTSDGTFGGLCPDGYVYNIEVADNNNYFANGILVHNCHRAVGSPTKAMQFYKVLSALSCRYKIGVTATPKRGDGMSRTMFALIGDVVHEVSREDVAHTTCPVEVVQVETGFEPNYDAVLCGDGTISYAGLVADITRNDDRFYLVLDWVERCAEKGSVLVLGNRVNYLQDMSDRFSGSSVCLSGMGNGKQAKAERKEALRMLNDGEIKALFATYQLAKEGLDVPNLRYVLFATPEKDEATVIQAAGRVARRHEGKERGTVIDFVDDFGMLRGWAKRRKNIYEKKLHFEVDTCA